MLAFLRLITVERFITYVETTSFFFLLKKLEFVTFDQITLIETSQRRSDLLTARIK